jgi:hypothetical protein
MKLARVTTWIVVNLLVLLGGALANVIDLTPELWGRVVVQAEHGKDTVVLFYDDLRTSFKRVQYAELAKSFPSSSVVFAALSIQDVEKEKLPQPFRDVAHDLSNANVPAMFFFRKDMGKSSSEHECSDSA